MFNAVTERPKDWPRPRQLFDNGTPSELLIQKEFSDLNFVVGSHIIGVHQLVVGAHSVYMAELLMTHRELGVYNNNHLNERPFFSDKIFCCIPDFSVKVVTRMIRFMYTGELMYSEEEELWELRSLAESLKVNHLIAEIDKLKEYLRLGKQSSETADLESDTQDDDENSKLNTSMMSSFTMELSSDAIMVSEFKLDSMVDQMISYVEGPEDNLYNLAEVASANYQPAPVDGVNQVEADGKSDFTYPTENEQIKFIDCTPVDEQNSEMLFSLNSVATSQEQDTNVDNVAVPHVLSAQDTNMVINGVAHAIPAQDANGSSVALSQGIVEASLQSVALPHSLPDANGQSIAVVQSMVDETPQCIALPQTIVDANTQGIVVSHSLADTNVHSVAVPHSLADAQTIAVSHGIENAHVQIIPVQAHGSLDANIQIVAISHDLEGAVAAQGVAVSQAFAVGDTNVPKLDEQDPDTPHAEMNNILSFDGDAMMTLPGLQAGEDSNMSLPDNAMQTLYEADEKDVSRDLETPVQSPEHQSGHHTHQMNSQPPEDTSQEPMNSVHFQLGDMCKACGKMYDLSHHLTCDSQEEPMVHDGTAESGVHAENQGQDLPGQHLPHQPESPPPSPPSAFNSNNTEDTQFKCEKCNKFFISAETRDAHVEKVHGASTGAVVSVFPCPTCGKCFKRSSNLKVHRRTHSGARPYKCEQCPLSFATRNVLRCHAQSHAEEMAYKCTWLGCGKTFKTRRYLKTHEATHTGPQKLHVCDICFKAFPNGRNLNRHKEIHQKETKNIGGKSVKTTKNAAAEGQDAGGLALQSETLTNAEVPTVNQDNIGSNIKTNSMQNHQGGGNNSLLVFNCSFCDDKFGEMGEVVDHWKEVHELENVGSLPGLMGEDITAPSVDVSMQTYLPSSADTEVVYRCELPTTGTGDSLVHGQGQVIGVLHPHALSQSVKTRNTTETVPDDLFSCDQCGVTFAKQITLRRHKKKEHSLMENVAVHTCVICEQTFANDCDLKKHMLNHNKETNNSAKHACTYCGKICTRKSDLDKHVRIHTGERPFFCSGCNNYFHERSNHLKHMRLCKRSAAAEQNEQNQDPLKIPGDNLFRCDVCRKTFLKKSSLKRHEKIHQLEAYQCSICWKTFYDSEKMAAHENIHNGLAPYSCSFCEMTFQRQGDFKKHERVHTFEKPYQCSYCYRTFNDASARKRHERRHLAKKTKSQLDENVESIEDTEHSDLVTSDETKIVLDQLYSIVDSIPSAASSIHSTLASSSHQS